MPVSGPLGSGSGDALVANPLSQFAATTSAQFAGVISDESGTGLVVLQTNATLVTPTTDDLTLTGRLKLDKGGDVASTGTMTLGADGNVFDITGTTTINEIDPTNWNVGNIVHLQFDGALQVTHNSGGTNDILLGDQTNWTTAAGDVLTLFYDGTDWVEVSRSEVGGGAADNLGNHTATQIIDSSTFGIQFSAASQSIVGSATGILHGTPTGDTHAFEINATAYLTVSETTVDIGGNDLDNAGVIYLQERAAAEADQVALGQIWVKNTTPNELWFTDDAGSDTQLGAGSSSLWTDAGTFAHLTTSTDDIVIGGTSQSTFGGDTASLEVAGSSKLFRFNSASTSTGALAGSIRGSQTAVPADDDYAFITLTLDNSASSETEFGRISWIATDVTAGTEDGTLAFAITVDGSIVDNLYLKPTGLEVGNGLTGNPSNILLYIANSSTGKFQVGTPADPDHFNTTYNTSNDRIDWLIRGDNCVRFAKATATSDVNFFVLTSSDTGVATMIQSGGSDTNVNIEIVPKGTGNVVIDNTLSFKTTYNIGTATASQAIDWNDGNYQKVVLDSGGSQTFTFTAPSGPMELRLELTENASGGSTITWPTTTNSDTGHNGSASGVTLYILEYIDGAYWFKAALY